MSGCGSYHRDHPEDPQWVCNEDHAADYPYCSHLTRPPDGIGDPIRVSWENPVYREERLAREQTGASAREAARALIKRELPRTSEALSFPPEVYAVLFPPAAQVGRYDDHVQRGGYDYVWPHSPQRRIEVLNAIRQIHPVEPDGTVKNEIKKVIIEQTGRDWEGDWISPRTRELRGQGDRDKRTGLHERLPIYIRMTGRKRRPAGRTHGPGQAIYVLMPEVIFPDDPRYETIYPYV